MLHNREEVIERTIRGFKPVDHLFASLTKEDWERLPDSNRSDKEIA
jgi:hypothetical protein